MALLKPTDTPADTPNMGHVDALTRRVLGVFDAARRQLAARSRVLKTTLRRQVRANSLIRVRRGRISIGIEVGDLGLGPLDSSDVGA